MLAAVSADFAAAPGVEVVTFPDGIPATDHEATFAEFAASADWSLVIAPETGGTLERLARLVLLSGGRLLGPSPDGIAVTSDKQRLGEHWVQLGVPTPRFASTDSGPPLVFKPRDGCGSDGVRLVHTPGELAALPTDPKRLVQEYVPGQSASVAFLIGPRQVFPLLPCFQQLSDDNRFRYGGGSLPLPPPLAERAVEVGLQAVRSVPGLFGYIGVDVVLGERDVAIEINPRLTTSYVGLRVAAVTNLAGAMLDVAEGRAMELRWRPGEVWWDADGSIR